MFTKTFLSAVVLIAALASANPIVKRQDSDVTCGSTVYYPASLQDAVKAGYQYLEDGERQPLPRPNLKHATMRTNPR